MEKANKIEQSTELRQRIEDVGALIVVEFSGLTVGEAEDLRGRFREAGCSYKVYKNSVIKYAVDGTKHAPLGAILKGTSGLAYHEEYPGAHARIAKEFIKDHEDHFGIKGGVIDGVFLDRAAVDRLAALPGPLELKAQLLALFNTPATHMVRVLNAPAQNLLNVLNAKKDKEAA
jgi:large subunit ribosomal protein L10